MNALRVVTLGELSNTDDGHYCSSKCGGGCTKAEFDRAVRVATKTASLLGPGWTPQVSENLGWHSRATCGERDDLGFFPAEVHPNLDGTYTAYLRVRPDMNARANSPREALELVKAEYWATAEANRIKLITVTEATL